MLRTDANVRNLMIEVSHTVILTMNFMLTQRLLLDDLQIK